MTQDTEKDAMAFVKRHKLTFPNALDNGIADNFKAVGHPMAFFIDAEGNILHSQVGALTEKELKDLFERFFF